MTINGVVIPANYAEQLVAEADSIRKNEKTLDKLVNGESVPLEDIAPAVEYAEQAA